MQPRSLLHRHRFGTLLPMQVYLVPGFFGFNQLGGFNYFQRVPELLTRALSRRGVEPEIINLGTRPTSSIRRRALDLAHAVRRNGGLEHDELHFVGHSTGGLDVRLLLTPGVALDPSPLEEEIAIRTRTAITLATPHFGTPLANVVNSLQGRNLLYALTLLATSRPGRLGVYAVAQALTHVARLDDKIGLENTLLDSLAERLLSNLTHEEGHAVYEFLREVSSDQGAMVQLTPEAIDLYNAAVVNRDSIEYVCYVTAAPPPKLRWLGRDIYRIASHAIFASTWLLASREHRHYPYPSPAYALEHQIREVLPFELDHATNDGIVPTLSQVWGRLGGVVVGDHLDVVGQFPHDWEGQRYAGWLHSAAGFDEERFERLWFSIADQIVACRS